MTMEKLLKDYNLSFVREYFDMIVESVSNDQFKQANEQFLAMPNAQRIEFLGAMADSVAGHGEWQAHISFPTLKRMLTIIY